jgi:hypothetical protein
MADRAAGSVDMSHEDESWDRVHQALKENDLALFVGAGVSYVRDDPPGGGLPGWRQFAEGLAKAADLAESQIWRLEKDGRMLPAIISLIQDLVWKKECNSCQGRDRVWTTVVRDVLYGDFKRALSQHGIDPEDEEFRAFLKGEQRYKEEHPGLCEWMEKRFASLTAIVKLCSAPASREDKKEYPERKWVPQRRIRALLTYNFDALIQIYDRALHGRRVFRTVERSSKKARGRKIPLYHLHGYLQPLDVGPEHEATDRLVLTEHEYHKRTDEAFNFAMTSTLWALRETVCVFVGCSMTDELMRRGLYRSRNERIRDSLFEGKNLTRAEEEALRHFAVLRIEDHRDELERDLRLLGVRPLWVHDFDRDLPRRIGDLERKLAAGM